MTDQYRFDDLDLREEPARVAKLDDEYAEAPTPPVYYTEYCSPKTHTC
jgi:hypothetical protein